MKIKSIKIKNNTSFQFYNSHGTLVSIKSKTDCLMMVSNRIDGFITHCHIDCPTSLSPLIVRDGKLTDFGKSIKSCLIIKGEPETEDVVKRLEKQIKKLGMKIDTLANISYQK